MKINAVLRLIRTLACGLVVLGASNVYAQENLDTTNGGTTATAGDNVPDASQPEIYYPPGMEIPLTETEIPGSAYFTGPDGERIDAATLMNQVPAGQEMVIPTTDFIEGLSPGQSFSVDGVYDGTLAFPMGTFPLTPFGERIISEVPADESAADNSATQEAKAGEIPGALLDENGNRADVAAGDEATPGMENGVPTDQVVRPDNSPVADQKKETAAGGSASRSVVEAKTSGDGNNQRLQQAISEQQRLAGLLNKANQNTETLEKELSQLKAARAKQKEASRSQVSRLTKSLKKAKAESKKTIDELKAKLKSAGSSQSEVVKKMMNELEVKTEEIRAVRIKSEGEVLQARAQVEDYQAKLKQMELAKEEVDKKVEALIVKAKEDAAKADDKIASAEARAEAARAEVLALTEKMATDSAAAGVSAAAGIAANAHTTEADMASKAQAKAAAELEVSRKLKEMEAQKKLADAATDAAEENQQGDLVEAKDRKETVLSLDDRIKRLKAKRDQQIGESETRIRAKQQREIDKLLEEGKSVESDEVKAAVEKMKEAIKTSEDKLRSRFLRRLERLKEEMKNSVK